MSKKKYLFLIHNLYGGGAERVASVLASALAEEGEDVYVALNERSEKEYPISPKVKIHVYKKPTAKTKIGRSVQRIRATARLIKEIKPDFTVGFISSVLIEGRIASLFKKTTYISAIRIDPMLPVGGRLINFVYKLCVKSSDGIFVQNKTQKEYYSKRIQKKVFYVYNPVSQAFLDGKFVKKDSIYSIATSGRLVKQKNHKMLIDAVALVKEKYPQIKLTIYGEGALKVQLQKQIDSLGLKDNVILYGRSDNMLNSLQNSHLFVLSSDYEGMPNALLEAMALGMPCISTDCRTGPNEMIVNGENGLLVPPNNKQAMADAICYMIENPVAGYDMGEKARDFAKNNCSLEKIVENFTRECETLCKKR